VDEKIRHLSVHRGHNLEVSNGHDALVDISAAKQMTFTGTRDELRERLTQLEVRGATGIIFGTSGYDVERELKAYAEGSTLASHASPFGSAFTLSGSVAYLE
jgi:5,10-methylenetetrahydromethanopterin reductase